MKKTLVFIAVLVLGGGVVGGTALAASRYLSGEKTNSAASNGCEGKPQQTHTLTIRNDKTSTDHIDAKRCDILTIVNTDARLRTMAFGVHDRHQAYNGVTEKILAKDQRLSVTLTETGSFVVHDHQQETVGSTFTVSD